MNFTIEDLNKILEYKTIINTTKETSDFNRNISFIVKDRAYIIEWYCNSSTLHIDDLSIPFHYAKLSNTWPHKSKMNIQFYDESGNVCCILKIDD